MSDQDDAPASEGNESDEASPAPEGESKAQADNQDSQDQEQSAEGKAQDKGEGEKLYKLVDGREVTADEVYKIYTKDFLPEFYQRSKKLAEYERQEAERKATAESDARQTIEEDEVLKNTPPHVKAALTKFVQPLVEQAIKKHDDAATEADRDKKFLQETEALEKEFPGGDGRPKFDRREIYQEIQKPGNRNFDQRDVFYRLHREEMIDAAVKEALKKQKGGTDTERTGTSQRQAPERKTPKTFNEAGEAFKARLMQSE